MFIKNIKNKKKYLFLKKVHYLKSRFNQESLQHQ